MTKGPAMTTARREIEVEWGHCDPAGIVFNPRFFEWFDAATASLFAHVGLPKAEMVKRYDIVGIPLVETRATFIRPVRFGDRVVIESRIKEFRTSSFTVEHQLLNAGTLSVEGFEVRVWAARDPADPGRIVSRPIPSDLKALFAVTP
jgi:4-hydroxybenzoyl-CoA thioesterase